MNEYKVEQLVHDLVRESSELGRWANAIMVTMKQDYEIDPGTPEAHELHAIATVIKAASLSFEMTAERAKKLVDKK